MSYIVSCVANSRILIISIQNKVRSRLKFSYAKQQYSNFASLRFLSRLRSCGLSLRSIQFLITALKSNPEHLAELHLMGNNLEDSGISVLVELTKNYKYTLRTLE